MKSLRELVPEPTPEDLARGRQTEELMRMTPEGDLALLAEEQSAQENIPGFEQLRSAYGQAAQDSFWQPELDSLRKFYPAARFYFEEATHKQQALLSEGIPLEEVLRRTPGEHR